MGAFDSMNINGGNARASFKIQLRADITGKKIRTLRSNEAVCLGAALLAGIAIGVYKDVYEAVEKSVESGIEYRPDSTEGAKYSNQFEQYKQLYPSLEGFRAL